MNCFIKTSITAVLMLICGLQTAEAQSDIDTNRMNRDINIMENVLEELFKTSWSADGNTVRVRSGMFSFGDGRDINGTFLPDYGIIFTIPGGPPGFVTFSDSDDEGYSFHFEYGDDNNGEKVTEESITNKIVEFLRDYASTISQLDDNHKVMVIYRANRPNRHFAVFSSSDDREKTERQQLPTISAVATGSDLRAHRSGDLSNAEFRERLEINSVPTDAEPPKDMRVMASILEAAFDGSEEDTFRLMGSVDHLQLDNFGALFSFEVRYSGQSHVDLSEFQESMEALKENLNQAQKEIEKTRAKLQDEARSTVDSIRSEYREKVEINRTQRKQNIINAYEQFVIDLKQYLIDYGRTLRSVDSDQQILVSVTINSRYEEIPESIDLQVQKSALEDMNSDQAMNEINVREY